MKKDLTERVAKLGFALLGTEDANSTLADVVQSKNLRLLEGFSVMLVNSAEKDCSIINR